MVLSVNYRSGIGYGMDFREALNYGAGGASEFNDVLGAGLYLRGRPDVDGASDRPLGRLVRRLPHGAWGCRGRRICSPRAWTSTACTTGTT